MVMLPRPEVDPDGLLEYSVVYTDRALNHMSARFVRVMADIDTVLTKVVQEQQKIVDQQQGIITSHAE